MHFYVCMCVDTCIPWYMCEGWRTMFGSWFSSCTMWVLRIKLRLPHLTASSFTQWTFSQALCFSVLFYSLCEGSPCLQLQGLFKGCVACQSVEVPCCKYGSSILGSAPPLLYPSSLDLISVVSSGWPWLLYSCALPPSNADNQCYHTQ